MSFEERQRLVAASCRAVTACGGKFGLGRDRDSERVRLGEEMGLLCRFAFVRSGFRGGSGAGGGAGVGDDGDADAPTYSLQLRELVLVAAMGSGTSTRTACEVLDRLTAGVLIACHASV